MKQIWYRVHDHVFCLEIIKEEEIDVLLDSINETHSEFVEPIEFKKPFELEITGENEAVIAILRHEEHLIDLS
jgi:hypothetical protein